MTRNRYDFDDSQPRPRHYAYEIWPFADSFFDPGGPYYPKGRSFKGPDFCFFSFHWRFPLFALYFLASIAGVHLGLVGG